MHIGQIIRDRRIELGLSQEDLATKLGKTKNIVSNWERGSNNPEVKLIKSICDALSISANKLFEIIEDEKKNMISELREDAEARKRIALKWFDDCIKYGEGHSYISHNEHGDEIEIYVSPLEIGISALINDLDFQNWSAEEIVELFNHYYFQSYLRKVERGEISFNDKVDEDDFLD